MEKTIIIQGRETTQKDIEIVSKIINDKPSLNRSQIAKELARLWNWRTANGGLKNMAAYSFLLKLEKQGQIVLPPRKRPPVSAKRNSSVPLVLHSSQPIYAKLKTICPIKVIAVEDNIKLCLFKCFLSTYHYLGFSGTVGEDRQRGLKVLGIASLTSYDQYGDEDNFKNRYKKSFEPNLINCVMVTKWNGKAYGPGYEKVFATSLDVTEPLKIIDNYCLRSLIENKVFRELKQGWNLAKIPMKKKNAIVSHTILTLIMYSLNACFQTKLGRALTNRGIRRLRDEDMSTIHKLIVFSGEYFAIFDVEEYSLIVRAPLKIFFRIDPDEAKKRLGLAD